MTAHRAPKQTRFGGCTDSTSNIRSKVTSVAREGGGEPYTPNLVPQTRVEGEITPDKLVKQLIMLLILELLLKMQQLLLLLLTQEHKLVLKYQLL